MGGIRGIVFVGTLLSAQLGWAWGSFGHRIIGHLTEQQLCTSARNQAREILRGESFAEASTWADNVRSSPKYDYLKPLHFVLIGRGEKYDHDHADEHGDVVQAVQAQVNVLKKSNSNANAKLQAVRLLLHFVADVHQPLHAGMKSDRGGTRVDVSWFGQDTNLHWVWDTGFLDRTNLGEQQFVEDLERLYVGGKPVIQLTAEDWANESGSLLDAVYDYESVHDRAPYTIDPSYGDFKRQVKLTRPYFDRHIGTVKMRMWQGSQRLVRILEEIWPCR